MENPKSDWTDWPANPKHKIGMPEHVHAFGQIALLYNYLEDFMCSLFQLYLPIKNSASFLLYYKLNNRERLDLLSDLVRANEKDPTILDSVLFSITCYDICTDNRNILLHSTHGETDPVSMSVKFSKRASSNPLRELNFDIDLTLLRRVADETGETADFVSNLWFFLQRPPHLVAGGDTLTSLPEKPQKPHKLTPSQPGVAPQAE